MIQSDIYHNEILSELTQNQFSISGGITQYQADLSIEEWICQVDKNLYTAKIKGAKIVG